MTEILVILVGEQAAPNALVLLEPDFSHVDKYWFISTEKMEKQGRTEHLLKATKIKRDCLSVFIVPPDDPIRVASILSSSHNQDNRYIVSLTGSTKMIGAGAWSFFIQKTIKAKILYVLSGVNTYRVVHPSEYIGDYALNYSFSVKTYLEAYGIAYEKPSYGYQSNPATEKQLLQDVLDGKQPITSIKKSTLALGYELTKEMRMINGELGVSYDHLVWLENWLKHLHFTPQTKQLLNASEVQYLQSLWLEHYLMRMIIGQLKLSSLECVHGWKLYPANDGERLAGRNHEFDLLFCYRNKLYVIEAKIGLGKAQGQQIKVNFNNALFRLAALKRDYGFHVQTVLITLTGKLRKHKGGTIQNHFAREADLLNVKIIDRTLLVEGPEVWVSLLLK
ncbi:hypothetical protein [Lewinella sp. LCG006]|uniref:hypothetical protein n=1 Tax=Lewinella sp. LCG006 TaxID=3231911 RepID=UPI0034609ABE